MLLYILDLFKYIYICRFSFGSLNYSHAIREMCAGAFEFFNLRKKKHADTPHTNQIMIVHSRTAAHEHVCKRFRSLDRLWLASSIRRYNRTKNLIAPKTLISAVCLFLFCFVFLGFNWSSSIFPFSPVSRWFYASFFSSNHNARKHFSLFALKKLLFTVFRFWYSLFTIASDF